MRDVYSKYWITARDKKYGFSLYDRNLCNDVNNQTPEKGKLLEVAVGTGEFADFFVRQNYEVHGVDISDRLIEKCKKVNSRIIAKVGDAEELDYKSDLFDCVYCFHSSWYFPNLFKAIDEMIRVTKPGGYVHFDIMNKENSIIKKAYRGELFECNTYVGHLYRIAKNIIKKIINRGTEMWTFQVHYTPTCPEEIVKQLNNMSISNYKVKIKEKNNNIREIKCDDKIENYYRLVFCIKK